MTCLPYLVDPRRLTYTSTGELLRNGLLNLGRITRGGAIEAGRLENARQCLAPEVRPEWERLLALEWLLARVTGHDAVAAALDAFADRPLSDDPASGAMPGARQLARGGSAIALVPLAAPRGGPPGVAALIVSPKNSRFPKDHRHFWEEADTFPFLRGYRLDGIRTPHTIPVHRGTSWQLGAALAARALREGNPTALLDLASDWLPTGSVRDDGMLEPVRIGNKTDLQVFDRRWMIPAGTHPGKTMRETDCDRPQTLDMAWNHLTRQGTIEEGGRQPWPGGIEALHSFVSGAREPVIAAALLSNAPRLVLWRTPNETVSRKPAEDIQHILRALAPALKVDFIDTPSNSMHAVEKTLEAELEAPLRHGRFFLFNVTQGNRLMGFAAHTLARRYPSLLWLLYRDNDDLGANFTAIRYDRRDFPVTFTLVAADGGWPDIVWKELLRPITPREATPWQELLAKIRPTTKFQTHTGK